MLNDAVYEVILNPLSDQSPQTNRSIKVEIKGVNPTSTWIPIAEEIYDTIAWLPFSYADQKRDVSNLAQCIWNDIVYWTQQSHQPL